MDMVDKADALALYMGRTYPATVAPDSGGYFAQHPDLPGCMTEGRTEAEALENLEAARELWIETRLENGYSVPEPAV